MLWALLIFILCMIPGRDLPRISWLEILAFDKFVHAGLFFVLLLLLARGLTLQQSFFLRVNTALFISFSVCVIYGGLLELLQGALFIERTADIYDFIANSFGAFIGMIFFKKLNEKILFKFIR